jgi:hypothetical protein
MIVALRVQMIESHLVALKFFEAYSNPDPSRQSHRLVSDVSR